MTKSITGGLLIDKPIGPTSHDIIDQVRRALNLRRVGHTGTLDPFASGLLLVLLGPATRLAEYLHDFPKTYTTTAILGATSTTDDSTGEILPVSTLKPSRGQLQTALARFQGPLQQTPPAFAAIKINGRRLYDIARQQGSATAQGLAAQKSRLVTIHHLSLNRYQYPEIDLTATVSSGTYIRSLIRDLGASLTTGAYAQALRRTQIGPWSENHQKTAHKVIKTENLLPAAQSLPNYLLTPTELLAHLPSLTLDPENVAKLQQGRKLLLSNLIDNMDSLQPNKPIAIHNQQQLIGIATYDPATSLLSPHKILPF